MTTINLPELVQEISSRLRALDRHDAQTMRRLCREYSQRLATAEPRTVVELASRLARAERVAAPQEGSSSRGQLLRRRMLTLGFQDAPQVDEVHTIEPQLLDRRSAARCDTHHPETVQAPGEMFGPLVSPRVEQCYDSPVKGIRSFHGICLAGTSVTRAAQAHPCLSKGGKAKEAEALGGTTPLIPHLRSRKSGKP